MNGTAYTTQGPAMTNDQEEAIVTGGKIYMRCPACGKLVRVNKPIIGSLHVCADETDPDEDSGGLKR